MRSQSKADLLRIALGLIVILGAVYAANVFQNQITEENHKKYIECLKTGMKPIACSFQVEFGE